ncbi:protein of unknown function DUF574 [Catenulispora acidiphila DSM 44928]|uniref:S-adenosyl methyltransferase n=1 Tax=Catenulispora acidiphila (strain DSM 44928 / JCM 14897 / NBRC 102108 / NRRL B-24433 / ID139908) TaxID=479433 RepID=C7QCG0_CATAD|nr:SAM-dependent methyltransferase [Catenulispora acidiphila]ACU74608.1 protein of unknown function DUF574 [Catenulispora acidiphila DSM 44928]
MPKQPLQGEEPTADSSSLPPSVDISVAHPARMYDYYLGGKDNYPADRAAAENVLAVLPEGRDMAIANRAFLGRAVRHLADAGIDQFLDIGTGIPGPGNTGQVADAVRPGSRVVYVDNDPIVLAHSRALLARHDPDRTAVVQADLRSPAAILNHHDVRTVLDFTKPIALLLVAVLHFIKEEEDPAAIVAELLAALAPGSYLVISHGTDEFDTSRARAAVRNYDKATAPFVLRSHNQIHAFFDTLKLDAPGLVQLPWWRPDGEIPPGSEAIWLYGGVGRKA